MCRIDEQAWWWRERRKSSRRRERETRAGRGNGPEPELLPLSLSPSLLLSLCPSLPRSLPPSLSLAVPPLLGGCFCGLFSCRRHGDCDADGLKQAACLLGYVKCVSDKTPECSRLREEVFGELCNVPLFFF